MVVALAVERLLNLRTRKIIPRLLVEDCEELTDPIDRFNPTAAYQSCLDQPSPAARVITAMLMRTGQPLADIERAATETIEREADQYASPIRWLTPCRGRDAADGTAGDRLGNDRRVSRINHFDA